MPCSRMPKCSVRPYGLPGHIAVWWSAGMNEGSPSIVVRLLSARSAEPPHSSGSAGADRGEDRARRLAGGHALGVGRERGERPGPAVRQAARGQPVEQRLALRVGARPGGERPLPFGVQLLPALRDLAGAVQRLVLDREIHLGVEVQDLLGRLHLGHAERGPVRRAGVLLVRGGPADDRAQRDERRRLGVLLGVQEAPGTAPGRPRDSRRPCASRPSARASRRPRSARTRPRTWRCWCCPRWRSGCRRRGR